MSFISWIGAGLGWVATNSVLGAIAGWALGGAVESFVGRKMSANAEEPSLSDSEGNRNGFLFSLMVLSAHIIQADGKIMHSEMETVRRFLRNSFGEQAEKPVAFIPPTWYSNNFLCKQVRKLGILFEDRFSITTMRGNRYASLVTSFAGIPDFLIKPAFKFGEFILKIPVGLPRIALHPVDFPTRAGEVRNILRTALGSGRKLVRYADL